MVTALFILVAIGLLALSIIGETYLPNWSPVNSVFSGVLGLVFLVLGLLAWMVQHFYVKPSANLAYVITGLGGRRVLIDRGGFFFPIVQRNVAVSLETMKLEVERAGTDALITKDNLRVDVKGEFYLKVLPDQDDVLNAARSLGEKSVNADSVASLVFEKLVSALRSVAATKDLVEIHSQREDFAIAVQRLVVTDLEQNGLTLESVTVSRLDQTSQELLSDNNIFDAQGKRKITEITQSALVERNRLEQEAMREITLKNVETRKETLELERAQAEAEAAQQARVASVRAERNREAETYRIEQERQVREAEIAQEQAVRTRSVERDRELLLREQELQRADVERNKVIELTERQREIAVAEAERQRAEAQKAFLEAMAKREGASQEVVTVQRLAEAEREAQTKLIAAKQKIEEDRVRQQTAAEVEAFSEVRRAEAQKQAATLEADAILSKAEAEAQSRERLARGDTAIKRVDVDIERERVNVEKDRVEVERQALENRQTYSQSALEFELQKLRIEAQRDVQGELARSIGEFMSRGNMNIFGSPETLARMTEQYARGLGVGQMIDGALEGTESLSNGRVQELIGQLQAMVGQFRAAQPYEAGPSVTSDGPGDD
jgi:flotillin